MSKLVERMKKLEEGLRFKIPFKLLWFIKDWDNLADKERGKIEAYALVEGSPILLWDLPVPGDPRTGWTPPP